jgi:hypothetical protein
MSLMRLAFWLALLVLLLPTDSAQQARFTSFAGGALERLSGFCDRNATTCEIGSAAWATFLRKAEFGLRLVGDLVGVGGERHASAPAPDQRPDAPPLAYGKRPGNRPGSSMGKAPPPVDALPPDPYQPPWRAPKRPKGYY